MKSRHVIFAILILFCAGCTKAPPPAGFLEAWNLAVGQKDAKGIWNLLDRDSQNRVLAALKKSQARAAGDKDFKGLFAAVNPSVDLSKSPEEIALGVVGQQLGGSFDPKIDVQAAGNDATLAWHEKTARIHIEDGQWRAAIGCFGLVLADGSPAAITLAWPLPQRSDPAFVPAGKPLSAHREQDDQGQDLGTVAEESYFEMKDGVRRAIDEKPDTEQPAIRIISTRKDSKGGDISKMSLDELDQALANNQLIPDAVVGFKISIDPNGTTSAEVSAGYALIAQRIAKLAALPKEFPDLAARAMSYYEDVIFVDNSHNTSGDTPYDVEYAVGVNGSLTATHLTYNRETRAKGKKAHPRLDFVVLPAA